MNFKVSDVMINNRINRVKLHVVTVHGDGLWLFQQYLSYIGVVMHVYIWQIMLVRLHFSESFCTNSYEPSLLADTKYGCI